MSWIRNLVTAKGGKLVTRRISGDLYEQEDELLSAFNAHYIVNATGLGAYETAKDSTVYPLRGALIRVVNDGKKFAKVTEALAISHDYAKRDDDGGIVFIVPRNDQTLILGGKSSHSFHHLQEPGSLRPRLLPRHRTTIRRQARPNTRQP